MTPGAAVPLSATRGHQPQAAAASPLPVERLGPSEPQEDNTGLDWPAPPESNQP